MKTLEWSRLSLYEQSAVLQRPEQRSDPKLQAAVASIVERVRTGGWNALGILAESIDGEKPRLVEVAPAAAEGKRNLAPNQYAAMEMAASNIRAFHEACLPCDVAVETVPGLTVRQVWRPIDRVGLYVPGGHTPLFSTLLMLAIPARAAGVGELVTFTPPQPGGGLDPIIALAAELCGIRSIWTVGGAQAIAAMAFGAGAIPRVDKICGPGNTWVAEAKRLVASIAGGPSIDMPAGPSELMIVADGGADPKLVAADLLSQAEHDPAAQVLLVTPSGKLAEQVSSEVYAQLAGLPRADIACASLAFGRLIISDDLGQALEIANAYAPEHLSLAVANADALVETVRNAGAVFAGRNAAESFGDYLAGSSHVLPTDGAARAWGGVSTYTFLKPMSVQTVTAEAARRIAGPAAMLARMESLEAHARAADGRLECAA